MVECDDGAVLVSSGINDFGPNHTWNCGSILPKGAERYLFACGDSYHVAKICKSKDYCAVFIT